jgi:hypothetical protein
MAHEKEAPKAKQDTPGRGGPPSRARGDGSGAPPADQWRVAVPKWLYGLLLLLVVSFVVLNWVYGYVVAFQSGTNDCFFLFGGSFLREFLDHPAGPLRYAGRFLGQFYHYRWLGALIVSACVASFGVLFHRVLSKLGGTVPVSQVLLPCALLVVLHTSTLWLLQDTLGLCASCGAFLGYLSLRGKRARRVYALVATPVVYLLLGAYAWLFVAWVAASEWLERPLRSGLAFKIGYLVFSIAVPLIAWRWVFMIPLSSAVTCPLMLDPPFRTGAPEQSSTAFAIDCLLAVLLCGLLVLIPFGDRLSSGRRFAEFWRAKRDRWSRVGLAVAIPVLAILLHWVRYDAPLATVVACRQLCKEKQWDALLEKAGRNPYGDLRLQFMTNLALWHKGELLEEMFSYPQPWGTRGLFMNFSGGPTANPAEDDTVGGMYNSDLLYEMGHANYALRHAYNSMCLQGKTYETLKRMAQCSMVNGNEEMAAKYLRLLERTLFHRRFARRYQAIIADAGAAEREFGELRKRLPTVEGFGHPVVIFATLLKAKPDNRMAFDYLMAWLLLDKSPESIDSICSAVGRFRTAGYASVPTHCQEAMLLREKQEGRRVDLRGFRYDETAVARVDEFVQYVSTQWDVPGAREQAQALYGDTYMFYYLLAATPSGGQRNMGARGGFVGTSRQE